MRRASRLLCCLPLFLAGCGQSYDESLKQPDSNPKILAIAAGPGEAKKLTPVKADSYDGVLTGKITFRGTVPTKVVIVPDSKPECLAAKGNPKNKNDIYDQNWFVGDGQGVENIVVFLKAPDGTFFEVQDADKTSTAVKKIDQPFCAFHPQVAVFFPSYVTKTGKSETTGERLEIVNTGDISHNANLQDADIKYGNSGFNESMPPASKKGVELNAQPKPLSLSCSIHPWMKANIWVFDHPYAAKTNDKGEFTIRNLPTGVDLQIVLWHPTVGFFDGGQAGKKINFKSGENKLDATISPGG
ncbi:MAG: hypothetical protein U0793_08640 [Gemmataceae bacterium]